jgi:DNA-binding IclR family transcriptional regulator
VRVTKLEDVRGSRPSKAARPRSEVGGAASVERALTLLSAFRFGERSLGLTELAARTGFYKSSVLRLLRSLTASGFVEPVGDGSYRLGSAVFYLGAIYRSTLDLGDILPRRLSAMVEQTGETSSFYVRRDDRRVCLYRIKPASRLTDDVVVGVPLPLDDTANSLVLQGYDLLLDPAALSRPVEIVVVTEDHGELAGLAAPVFGDGHKGNELIGALALSGPKMRFGAAEQLRFKSILRDEAKALTRRLGGNYLRFD